MSRQRRVRVAIAAQQHTEIARLRRSEMPVTVPGVQEDLLDFVGKYVQHVLADQICLQDRVFVAVIWQRVLVKAGVDRQFGRPLTVRRAGPALPLAHVHGLG